MEKIIYRIYQKFTSFFEGKKNSLFLMLFVFFVVLCLTAIKWSDFEIWLLVRKNTLIAVFANFGQTLITLVAILIAIAIFRTQSIEDDFPPGTGKQGEEKKGILWKLIVKYVIYIFVIATLDFFFLAVSDIIYDGKLGIPFLFLAMYLSCYGFYLIIKGSEEVFFSK